MTSWRVVACFMFCVFGLIIWFETPSKTDDMDIEITNLSVYRARSMAGGPTARTAAVGIVDNSKTGLVCYSRCHRAQRSIMLRVSGSTLH